MLEDEPSKLLITRSPSATNQQNQETKPNGKSKGSFIVTFVLLFGTWILLSGRFDLFHLALGVISCLIVAFISHDLMFDVFNLKKMSAEWPKFVLYIPWLLFQVFKANIHVMILVFHPNMINKIDPKIVKFKSRLKSDISMTTLANSITLTPGTITVYASEFGEFEVHAIDKASAEGLPGEMETKIANIFNE